jgi:hypothetical protein
MTETAEILQTIDRLNGMLADLIVRGLRSVAPAQVALLDCLREEFERIRADHLAGEIGELARAVREEESSAALALLRAQTSLNLFERILTLEQTMELLEKLCVEEGKE